MDTDNPRTFALYADALPPPPLALSSSSSSDTGTKRRLDDTAAITLPEPASLRSATSAHVLARAKRREASRIVDLSRVARPDNLDDVDVWSAFGVVRVLGAGSEGVVLLTADALALKATPTKRNQRGQTVGAQALISHTVLEASAVPLPHIVRFYGWMRCRDSALLANVLAHPPPQRAALLDAQAALDTASTSGITLSLMEYVGATPLLPHLTLLLAKTVPKNDMGRAALVRVHTLRCAVAQVYAQLELVRAGAIRDFNHGDLGPRNMMAMPDREFDAYEYVLSDDGTGRDRYQVPLAALDGHRVVIVDLGSATGHYKARIDSADDDGDGPRQLRTVEIGTRSDAIRYDANFWSRWAAFANNDFIRDMMNSAEFAGFRSTTETRSGSTLDSAKFAIDNEQHYYRDTVLAHSFFDELRVDTATGLSMATKRQHPAAKTAQDVRIRYILAPLDAVATVEFVKSTIATTK